MLISTKGRYAIRIMVDMAQRDKQVYTPPKEIAESEDISEKYLESIVGQLSKAGLVEGVRGKGGGYRIKVDPAVCTVREVVQVADGSLAPVACLEETAELCEKAEKCRTLPMWKILYDRILNCLENVTVEDLVRSNLDGISE